MSLDFGAHLVYGVLVPADKLEAMYAKLPERLADQFHEAIMDVATEVGDGDQVIGFYLSSINVRDCEVDDLGESLPSASNPEEMRERVREALRGLRSCKHCGQPVGVHRVSKDGGPKCRKKSKAGAPGRRFTPSPLTKADHAIEQLIAYLDKEPFHYLLLGTVT